MDFKFWSFPGTYLVSNLFRALYFLCFPRSPLSFPYSRLQPHVSSSSIFLFLCYHMVLVTNSCFWTSFQVIPHTQKNLSFVHTLLLSQSLGKTRKCYLLQTLTLHFTSLLTAFQHFYSVKYPSLSGLLFLFHVKA